MSRKKYIIIILLFTIPVIPICIYIDNTKFEHVGTILIHCLCSFVCFFTSYLLIYIKSYNILAGMTEEEFTRIEKIPKEKEKMERVSKRVGYIFAFIGILLLLFTIYFIWLKKTQFKLYRPQKVRPKNLTFWRSVFLWLNIILNLKRKSY